MTSSSSTTGKNGRVRSHSGEITDTDEPVIARRMHCFLRKEKMEMLERMPALLEDARASYLMARYYGICKQERLLLLIELVLREIEFQELSSQYMAGDGRSFNSASPSIPLASSSICRA